MNNYSQNAKGLSNTQVQNIYNSQPSIEFLPSELEDILTSIIDNENEVDGDENLTPPDLPVKNELNSINSDYFELIEEDFIHFNSIEDTIKNDSSGVLKSKYSRARKVLQLKYLGDYSPNFPSFVSAVMNHFMINNQSTSESLKVVALLHYMYSECEIGRKPQND